MWQVTSATWFHGTLLYSTPTEAQPHLYIPLHTTAYTLVHVMITFVVEPLPLRVAGALAHALHHTYLTWSVLQVLYMTVRAPSPTPHRLAAFFGYICIYHNTIAPLLGTYAYTNVYHNAIVH